MGGKRVESSAENVERILYDRSRISDLPVVMRGVSRTVRGRRGKI